MDSEWDNSGEDELIEAEYSTKSDFSKARIVEKTLMKASELRANEMKAGYFNSTISSTGSEVKTWVQDSRKAFMSSIDALIAILAPEILAEKEIRDFIIEIEKGKSKLIEKYGYRKKKMIDNKLVSFGEKYIPEKDEAIPVLCSKLNNNSQSSEFIEHVVGYWNGYVDRYWEELLVLYDKLFGKINILIHKGNYFKQKGFRLG